MKIKLAAILCATALLNACATATIPDPRPLEVQKSELDNAVAKLTGNYIVKDSRGLYPVYASQFKSVELSSSNGVVALKLTLESGLYNVITSIKCDNYHPYMGNEVIKRKVYLYCNGGDGSRFWLNSVDGPETIKSGALISTFKPMVVDHGYILTIFTRVGLSSTDVNYWALEKKGI